MDIQTLKSFFGIIALINFGLLLYWGFLFMFARNWLYKLHNRWYNLSDSQFNAIHYAGIMIYKLAIFLFAVTPWLALMIIGD